MPKHEIIAYLIQEKLNGSNNSFGFYCKAALKLPENKLWFLIETAQRGRNPGALFNYLATKEMSNA